MRCVRNHYIDFSTIGCRFIYTVGNHPVNLVGEASADRRRMKTSRRPAPFLF